MDFEYVQNKAYYLLIGVGESISYKVGLCRRGERLSVILGVMRDWVLKGLAREVKEVQEVVSFHRPPKSGVRDLYIPA